MFPLSPYISVYLHTSPYIFLYLPISPRRLHGDVPRGRRRLARPGRRAHAGPAFDSGLTRLRPGADAESVLRVEVIVRVSPPGVGDTEGSG